MDRNSKQGGQELRLVARVTVIEVFEVLRRPRPLAKTRPGKSHLRLVETTGETVALRSVG